MIPTPSPWPRALATWLAGLIILVFSTTLFAWWEVGGVRLQPLTVVAVSAGFHLPMALGGVVVFSLGILADLLSGGFVGLSLSALMFAFLMSAIAQRWLDISSWQFQMVAVGLLGLFGRFIVLGGLILAERGYLAPAHGWPALSAGSVLAAITAPLFFHILEKMVAAAYKIWPSSNGQGMG